MQFWLRIPLMAMFLLLLWGCRGKIETRTIPTAEADALYASIDAGDTDEILRHYSAEFFAHTPRSKWRKALAEMHAEMGDYHSHVLVDKQFGRIDTPNGDIATTVLVYNVIYEKARSRERLEFYEDSGGVKLVGHSVERF